MSKTLVMNFLNESGQKSSIRVNNVKDTLTDVETKAAMDVVIANDIFQTKGGNLVQKDSAHVIDSETTEIF